MQRERSESVGVFLVFALLYAATAATTAQGGDASEFMAIAGGGGVAHPPGYPLFSLLVRAAAALIPWGTVAWRASLVAALQAAGALAVIYALVRHHTGRPVPALIAAASLGLSLHFWRYATVSEVFAGGALTAALTLAAALHTRRAGGGPLPALLFGLALSTGIANHHTVVLLFPLGIYALIALLRGRRPLASILAGAGGLLPGFLAYLTLTRPGGVWRWGDTVSPGGLLHHFLRRDYGTFRLAISDAQVGPLDNPLHWLGQLPQELFGVFALLGAIGLVRCWRVRRDRGWWLAAAASLVVAGPVFLSAVNLPAEGDSLVITSRFYILPDTLLSIFVGLGAAQLLDWTGGSRPVRLALLGALLGPALINADKAPHRGWTVLEDYLLNALRVVEPGALVLGQGDPSLFGMIYVQEVLGVRQDVSFVAPNMLGYGWYRGWLLEKDPRLVLSDGGRPLKGAALARANRSRRAVYLRFNLLQEEDFAALAPVWPVGAVLMRLGPEGAVPPDMGAVEAELRSALAAHTLRSRVETPFEAEETWEYKDYDQYARAFDTLANAWASVGRVEDARRCRRTASALSPYLFATSLQE